MKKLFPSEICNSNSRYCVCSNMTLICYLKFLGTVIIIFFHYFQYPFFSGGVWTSIGEKLRNPLSEFSLLSSVQVPFNTGRCRRRIVCHCWLLHFNKIIQLWEKPPCQRHSGLLLVDLIVTRSCSCLWLIYLIKGVTMAQYAKNCFYIISQKENILFPKIFQKANLYYSVRKWHYSGLYPPPFRLPDIKCTTRE